VQAIIAAINANFRLFIITSVLIGLKKLFLKKSKELFSFHLQVKGMSASSGKHSRLPPYIFLADFIDAFQPTTKAVG
jgi:hypothetical protein